MADAGSLGDPCDEPECQTDDGPCEGCEYIDMHGGPYCTLDVAIQIVRPARGD
jgi:hypothetical protein